MPETLHTVKPALLQAYKPKKDTIMKKHASKWAFTLMISGLSFVMAIPALAQPADTRAAEILQTVRQEYERSIENIDDYKVVSDMYTTYYKKAYDNGRPYFRSRMETDAMGGMESTSSVSDAELFSPETFETLQNNAIFEGTETIDGYEVHIIYIEEIEGLLEDEEDLDETLTDLRIFIDTQNWVMRQMAFSVQAAMEDGMMREIEPVIQFKDYRNHQGMLIPWETVTIISGLDDALSDEERQEAEEGLREMERELENMPEAQRDMVKRMMGDQLEQLRNMLAGDQMEFITRVHEVEVNIGVEGFD